MIIEKIEAIPLRIPFERRGAGTPTPLNPSDALYLVLCRVTTRSGLQGYGECLCYRAPMQRALVSTLVDAIAPLYLGRSVDDREASNFDVRRRFASFGRSGTVLNALAAVDIALWDIAGKSAGQSLSAMLGGARRERLPVMASLDKYDDGRRVRTRIEQALAAGVAAVKVHESRLAVIEEGRKAVEPSVPYVADLNNALTLAELEGGLPRWQALRLLWLEDPVWPPEALLGHALAEVTIGLGADLGTAEQLALYARSPAVGVLQPDVCMMGGLSEARRCLELLASSRVTIAPHTPFVGPAALASLHMMAVMEKECAFAAIEADAAMDPYGLGLALWRPAVDLPTGPGLGADPEPGFLERFAA